ncbi:unnamed protein product (macronuclear) [Paramecium tetraurelia]|uniref:Uncharacterized protein n=1 Tax=Paramecium tetraurelia TaxID=5888 RepID=A0DRH1_PARTE|nr:uncharacterized protein GSPATT00019355001 [Paramecium tetraurelia]CAK85638.1 unnamed protein product [Paramecium tetraurelia]|eukprot:XP_001453035.1 hypothetical protein (macronuclear) [Paramecium tetraurelia strain d4-2]
MQQQLNSQVILDRNQEFKGVEFQFNSRKIVVENIDSLEPLSKYIDADKLNEILNYKIEDSKKGEEGMKLNSHIKYYDFSRPPTGIPKKAFRAYSAIAKKKK